MLTDFLTWGLCTWLMFFHWTLPPATIMGFSSTHQNNHSKLISMFLLPASFEPTRTCPKPLHYLELPYPLGPKPSILSCFLSLSLSHSFTLVWPNWDLDLLPTSFSFLPSPPPPPSFSPPHSPPPPCSSSSSSSSSSFFGFLFFWVQSFASFPVHGTMFYVNSLLLAPLAFSLPTFHQDSPLS